jgi:uncharacterized protein (DUF2344 family)
MKLEFTNAEKVLFKATYDFAIKYEKLSEADATEKAMNKILSKRALATKLKFKH